MKPPAQLGFGFGFVRPRRKRRLVARCGGVPHRARPRFERRLPVHVTMRMAEHVWNLRSRRSLRALDSALRHGSERFGSRVVQFSLQGNHVHLLIEANNTASLVRAMKGLGVRIARGMNRLMGARGRVLGDRYHSRVLHTPTEVRRVVSYIRNNHRHHTPEVQFSAAWVDPYSSDAPALAMRPARTWLVRHVEGQPPGP
jgi:REP element-mobilizing transposase RayT